MAEPTPAPHPTDHATATSHAHLLEDEDFKALTSQKDAISLVLTLITLVAFFSFIYLLAYGRGTLATKVGQNVTLGIPFGIGVIILSWILTGIYVWWANSRYDSMVARVRAKVGGSQS